MRVVRSCVALALLLVPSIASAAPPTPGAVESHPPRAQTKHAPRTARVQKTEHKGCLKAAVEVVGAAESSTFSLAKCDGAPAPLAIDQLSILARPGGAAKPKVTVDVLAKSHGPEVSPGIRRIDPRLVERLETAIDHFRKPGQPAKVLLVSGYRPKSAGSYHQSGRALDFRIDGVDNEALVAFCKTLPDTGCGYYPNSSFVHLDVRDAGAGHVAWIDISRPGEPPKYVASWPRPGDDASKAPAPPVDEPHLAPALMEAPLRGRKLDRHPYFF
ncbi:MAG TPA: DUF882 domain-containing protein [Polyangiaceae bacterium]|jgi:hypothetical protein